MNRKTLICLSLMTLVALISSVAHTQTYKTYAINGGADPQAGVTVKGDFIYGTAASGGLGGGVAFEVKHLGTIYNFLPPSFTPEARIVFGPDGHLYGTTAGDGVSDLGVVYNLMPNPTLCKTALCQPFRFTVLHQFQGFPSDGAHPAHGDLIWDRQGNIYGTTTAGGTNELGVVYEMMPPVPPSKTWTEQVIWNFSGPDGENPQSGVVFDANGNLLGTAQQGGANGFGTVYKLTPAGNAWTQTNLYDFQGGNDGEYPIAGLMIDGSGNIYGATSHGGSGGGGTVFELMPSGKNTYSFKLLYSFSGPLDRNCGPWATLSMDATGGIYGTTYCDAPGSGSVFKLTNAQNGWAYTSLHDFGEFDLAGPQSNVSFDAIGNLWGTASGCLPGGCTGGVWEIIP